MNMNENEPARILIATDGSEGALAAARQARRLLNPQMVSQVTVVAVTHPFIGSSFGDPALVAPLPQSVIDEMSHSAESAAQDAVRRTIEELGELGAQAQSRICTGRTADEIVRTARDEGTDLIVIGSRGWGEARAMLLGSVSEQVLHHAPCAVFIVRSASGRKGG